MDAVEFVQTLRWSELPSEVRKQAKLCLLDLTGIAVAGSQTQLSRIIRNHAVSQFPGAQPLPFDGRGVSASGTALAFGMTIDAIDGHDGYNPAKGHVGCGLYPGLLALARQSGNLNGQEFLTSLVAGYEVGSRLGAALHATVPDYHTSGAWVAVAIAATGAQILGLSAGQTAHAMGIAEYHGPRSQMMRCIDHPTMLKDGSGWGAMAGVSAVLLARDGFTGAPALTISEPREIWGDVGSKWLIMEQYFKPYPVCRWAQPAVEAVVGLRQKYDLTSEDVSHIHIATFHESTRLATAAPETTEEAQYSTSFPVAVALVRGRLSAMDIGRESLSDPEVLRLSRGLKMTEDDYANAHFPSQRYAKVTLRLRDGTDISSAWTRPRWDADTPPTEEELVRKFRDLSNPILGPDRTGALCDKTLNLDCGSLADLDDALSQPISDTTTP